MSENFFEYIKSRGFIHQCTNESNLKLELSRKMVTGYIGFDCTADSLHVGSLLPIMLLKTFQKFNHKPIILIGGGTTLIGDPSGKDETRKIIDEETINVNKEKLKLIFEKYLDFDPRNKNSAVLVDNHDWLKHLKYISFLRKVGKSFSVNKMLNLESVKQRLQREQNLSFLEFNYSIFQAYDFLELFQHYECQVQFGGSDQWGNIVSGIDLIKKEAKEEVFGLTTPLLTTSSGNKMGKTAEGAIWLSSEKLKPFDFWQFWRNTADEDVIKFLNLFTEIENRDLFKYEQKLDSEINNLKIVLANEVTSMCHSRDDAKKCENDAKRIISNKKLDYSLIKSSEKKILVDASTISNGFPLKEALIKLELTSSSSEAKRMITQGAVKINDTLINAKEFKITKELFVSEDSKNYYLIIYVGKKNFGFIELVS